MHVTRRFGEEKIGTISRDDMKDFLADLSENEALSRNTVRLIITALRAVLNGAVEDKLIESNPASKVGRFNKKEKGKVKAQSMTLAAAHRFLESCRELCPDYHPFFFTALRAGLRRGELIALPWGDVHFGDSEDGRDRFILVERNCYMGNVGTPKNHESWRVDMAKQLHAVRLEHKQEALLKAFQLGKTSIADELVFPSEAGTPISPDNIATRCVEPALEKAVLRRFRLHDLRHACRWAQVHSGDN